MGLIIEKMTGEFIDLDEIGIHEEERIVIGSPDFEGEFFAVEGMHGLIAGETYFRGRPIQAKLISLEDELGRMARKRSQIFWLFDARQPFWLTEKRERGRRWLVKCTSPYSVAEVATIGRFDLDLTALLPFSQTRNPITQAFSEPSFIFRNEGTEVIDMANQHMQDTEITFQGASSQLAIRNLATGKVWSYKGSSEAADTITIKGPRSLKNGQSIFGETNHETLTFSPGRNQIEITGATGPFQLQIKTRFYFQ